jgi:hypothetical protein
MIEIGKMGGSGSAVMQRLLQEMEAATHDSADLARSITEADTQFGSTFSNPLDDDLVADSANVAEFIHPAQAVRSKMTGCRS